MWMRLATPVDDSGVLGNVFHGNENPLAKGDTAAMKRVQELAKEGKLYLRDNARSRHFRKVELDGDQLKLGEQHEAKFSNRKTGFVLSLLDRLSRRYFRWWGLDSLANIFDRRIQKRNARIEEDKRYKEEYKSLDDEQKKRLKSLRKQEKEIAKNQKKLEKLQKEFEKAQKKMGKTQQEMDKTQQNLDKLNGKGPGANNKGEMPSLLSNPPDADGNKVNMQPNLLGDPSKKPVDQKLDKKDEQIENQQENKQLEDDKKKDTGKEKEKTDDKLVLNEAQFSKDNMAVLPENIQAALKLVVDFLEQQKALQTMLKQTQIQNEQKQQENTRDENLIDADDHQNERTNTEQNEQVQQQENIDPAVVQQETELLLNLEQFTPVDQNNNENQQQTNDLIDLESFDAVNQNMNENQNHVDVEQLQQIFQQPAQEAPTLQQRLAAEQQSMDNVKNWKDFLANTLFSHEEAAQKRVQYDAVKNNDDAAAEYLSGAVLGLLAKNATNADNKQQVLDTLLSGNALGSGNDALINDGINAYNDAFAQHRDNNNETLEQLLGTAVRELTHQASRETSLSPRMVMLGRLMSQAMKTAQDNQLTLPLNENELAFAQGVTELSNLAEKYHNARQFLGNGNADLTSLEGKNAVRDLLTGNAIEKMIHRDQEKNEEITNTQKLMGKGLWSGDRLAMMTDNTTARKEITGEQVQKILEDPNGGPAQKAGDKVLNSILDDSEQRQNHLNNHDYLENVNLRHIEIEQPENPMLNANNMVG